MLISAIFFDIDYFEIFFQWIMNFEAFELDEFVFPFFIIIFFLMFDLVTYKKELKIKAEKEVIYKAMVQASDHVLKNCLNQMQLVKYAAEETPGFDPEVLEKFDTIVDQAVTQLASLGKIEEVDKETIGKSINIKIYE